MNPAESSLMAPDASGGELRAGQMLKAAREAKGIHLAMLSVALKVPIRKLERWSVTTTAASRMSLSCAHLPRPSAGIWTWMRHLFWLRCPSRP